MHLLIDTGIISISLFVLCKGAIWLVNSASKLAARFGVPELIIGLTIVAFGTSAPEFGVSILAAFRGAGDISVGNVIGSNIFNLGIILGGAAIIRNLNTDNFMVYRDGLFLLISSVFGVLFLWDLQLNRTEGFILIGILVFYLIYLFHDEHSFEYKTKKEEFRLKDGVLLISGLILLFGGSHFLVNSASSLAKSLGVSEWIIGATIVAAGTSAPEIATSFVAAIKGHSGISIGNLIGSDIFNILGVMGLAGVINNLQIETAARSSLGVMVFMVVIVLVFLRTEWKLSRKEGFALLLFGITRFVYSLIIQ